jgi:cytoskeleton protein RodZ
MTNFGARFKQARESKGISLDQIATETRISTRFLSAIENEEFQLLPGGIFNRGFVRAFAEKVGLDPDQAVADYERMAEVRQPEQVAAPPQVAPPSKRRRSLYPIAIGVLALVIVVFYVVTRESGNIAQTASTPATPAGTAPQPATTPAESAPPVTPPGNARQPTAALPESEPNQSPKPAPAPAPIPTPAPQATAPASPPAPNALSLEIDAQDTSWIKVVADGKSANPGEILQSGMTRKYTAQNKLILSVGNAGGLALKLNDKPLKALGKTGQVREIIITPETAKKYVAE